MRAIQMTNSIPRYAAAQVLGRFYQPAYYGPLAPLRYRELPIPELPGPQWLRIKTRLGGICGSDLHTLLLDTSLSLSALSSFPFVLGHENVGLVDAAGPAAGDFTPGERVVAEPLLPCAARGIDPPCPACARGDIALCRNFAAGNLRPGMGIGNCADTGGSWGAYFVAHRSQVFRVPANVSDASALLAEPLAVAAHAILRDLPADNQTAIVAGAGVIGLCTVAALRAAGSRARIIALARYPFQAAMARRLGADEIVSERGTALIAAVARLTDGTLLRPIMGPPVLVGGADIIYECVGSAQSINACLQMAQSGGRVILAGLADKPRGVDWTPIWLNELTLEGTFWCGISDEGGRQVHDTERVLGWMAQSKVDLSPLLTHTYPLADYKRALGDALHRKRSGVLKAAFRYD